MKPLLSVALLLASFATAAGPQAADLAWMTGCWSFERDGKHYDEVWLPPAAGAAQGMARTYKADRMLSMEFSKLVRGPDGVLAYIANPSGKEETAFKLVKLEGAKATFENLAHDFPQRVIYAYTAPDRLDARIEGSYQGKPGAEDYPFRRMTCPSKP